MKIKEIKETLKNLDCKALCTDNKTLVAYNQIQFFLNSNKTPMKAITKIYWAKNDYDEEDKILRIVLYNNDYNDFESGYTYKTELECR